ncbi:hypothetical protein Gotur_034380 [Gossypium turneri]
MSLYLGEHLEAKRAKIRKLEQVSGATRDGPFHMVEAVLVMMSKATNEVLERRGGILALKQIVRAKKAARVEDGSKMCGSWSWVGGGC